MPDKIKWGVMGLGKIAGKFAADLILSENSLLYAVASRDIDKAKKFAAKHSAVNYYGSYRELAEDPGVDIVYIATPHPLHYENTMMCLENNKAVLVEKPIAMNYKQAKEMTDKAKEKGVFLMEAMWSRFIPSIEKALEIVDSGEIGEVIYTKGDFGFIGDPDPEKRVYNKKLGGGSLLDIGIYPLYLSQLFLGTPEKIQATARFSNTGVDSFLAALLEFKNNKKAFIESSFEFLTPTEGFIFGDKGFLKLHTRFHHTTKISVYHYEDFARDINFDLKGNGYYYEIESVNKCLNEKLLENPKYTHSDSLNLISSMDKIRKIIGLEYDADN